MIVMSLERGPLRHHRTGHLLNRYRNTASEVPPTVELCIDLPRTCLGRDVVESVVFQVASPIEELINGAVPSVRGVLVKPEVDDRRLCLR